MRFPEAGHWPVSEEDRWTTRLREHYSTTWRPGP